jgi:3-hydroxyacyl-CoA dehydrogenase/enoyl-CoA hydratase/3-hydroxybutyryl-CoA epimerase
VTLLRERAAVLIERLRDGKEPTASKSLKARLVDSAVARPQVLAAARKKLLDKGGHLPAPFKALTAVEQGLSLGMADGQAIEAKLFSELVGTPVNKALVHVFQTTTAAKGAAAKAKGQPVHQIGIVGGGLMGSGIAIVAAVAGIPARLRDNEPAAVGRALQAADDYFAEQVASGRLQPHDKAQKVGLISGTVDGTGMKGCDVLVEAVFEDLALKRRILADWEQTARPDAVFATNTSSLSIAAIAAGARHPERVVGMHFFSPVPKMPLVEVIVHPGTAQTATDTVVTLAKRMGKHVIVVNDGVGFYTSRVIGAYLNETVHLIADGAAVEQIDAAMVAFGFPVGPCTLMDEVGLDVGQKVTHILHEAFGDRMKPPVGYDNLITPLRRGRKSERGFYVYDEPGRPVDETVYSCFPGRKPGGPSEAAIQQRLALAFCNEAAWALSDGVLRSAADGDLGAIYGLGFPAFLGGPFWYLESLGLARVVAELDNLATAIGPRFTPATVLRQRSASGQSLFAGI